MQRKTKARQFNKRKPDKIMTNYGQDVEIYSNGFNENIKENRFIK